METSLKTGFAQIFSCCPKILSCLKFWGGCSPRRPPGPYAYGICVFLRRPSCDFFCFFFSIRATDPISGNAFDAKRKQKAKQINKQIKPKKTKKNMSEKKGPVRESNPGPLAP